MFQNNIKRQQTHALRLAVRAGGTSRQVISAAELPSTQWCHWHEIRVIYRLIQYRACVQSPFNYGRSLYYGQVCGSLFIPLYILHTFVLPVLRPIKYLTEIRNFYCICNHLKKSLNRNVLWRHDLNVLVYRKYRRFCARVLIKRRVQSFRLTVLYCPDVPSQWCHETDA